MQYLVAPLVLTEQQIEYVLSGYAAFQEPDVIQQEFEACFPKLVEQFQEQHPEDWDERLERTIRELYPGDPNFPKKYDPLFSSMRRGYISQLEDEKLSSARARLHLMEETLDEIGNFQNQNPESTLACAKLKLDVLKEARAESLAFIEAPHNKNTFDERSYQQMIDQLDEDQVLELRQRLKDGEHLDLILLDLRENAKVINPIEVDDETSQTEQAEEEKGEA